MTNKHSIKVSEARGANDRYYTFGNSAATRDHVMSMLKQRFGDVTKTTDADGRWLFKNKDGIVVGMSDIDGEGDRTWNVFSSDTGKIKEDFKVMREMAKLIPRGKLSEAFGKPTKQPKLTHASGCGYTYGHDCDCKMVKTHDNNCDWRYGHDCDCGLDDDKRKAGGGHYEFDEAVRTVPAGTFTPVVNKVPEKNPGDAGYDWRNPNHNPTGVKPAGKPHVVKGKYNPDNYPVLDAEHDTHLFDPEFIDHMREVYPNWDTLDELEQIKLQYSYVEPMPRAGYDFDEAEKQLKVKAIRAQKQIKR